MVPPIAGATIFLAAVGLRNGGVVAGDGYGAGIFQGLAHHFVEGEPLVLDLAR